MFARLTAGQEDYWNECVLMTDGDSHESINNVITWIWEALSKIR